MIFGTNVVNYFETKENLIYNLVIWRKFVWSFGVNSFGRLA